VSVFFRLQQYVALTPVEARALATIGVLLLLGLAAQRIVVDVPPPPPPSERAERFAALADSIGALPLASSSAIGDVSPAGNGSARPPARRRAPAAAAPVYVNLNTASQAELERLPRIGPAMAQRILDLRAEVGAFGSVDELERVRGIGPKTLDRLRPHVYVE
jgi:competence ComEA-like helix-hairpin-helix protein